MRTWVISRKREQLLTTTGRQLQNELQKLPPIGRRCLMQQIQGKGREMTRPKRSWSLKESKGKRSSEGIVLPRLDVKQKSAEPEYWRLSKGGDPNRRQVSTRHRRPHLEEACWTRELQELLQIQAGAGGKRVPSSAKLISQEVLTRQDHLHRRILMRMSSFPRPYNPRYSGDRVKIPRDRTITPLLSPGLETASHSAGKRIPTRPR